MESSEAAPESLGDLSEVAEGIKVKTYRKKKADREKSGSLFDLAEKDHRKFKQELDKLFAGGGQQRGLSQDDEDDLATVIEYFFDLCGLRASEDDTVIGEMIQHISNDDTAKFEKVVRENAEILQTASTRNFLLLSHGQLNESLVASKNMQQLCSDHKKAFKRFAKLLVTNLVDMFPQRKDVLPALVNKVVSLAGSKQRLIRLSFTQISIQLLKHILENLHESQVVMSRLESSQT